MLVATHILFSFLMLTAGVELNDNGNSSFRLLLIIGKILIFKKVEELIISTDKFSYVNSEIIDMAVIFYSINSNYEGILKF